MKVRNGFVSNSSSSSFLIAVKNNIKEDDVCPHCGRKSQNILSMIRNRGYNETEMRAEGNKETLDWFIDMGWYEEETYNKIRNKINEIGNTHELAYIYLLITMMNTSQTNSIHR